MENVQKREVILEVKDLKKYFSVSDGFLKKKKHLKAVDGVNLTVNKGETIGIVGESGCGKSTFGNLILRLANSTEGKIILNGKDITNTREKDLRLLRKDIQMIFQDPSSSLNPRMSVFDIIAEPLRTHKNLSKKELKDKVYDLMDKVGLSRTYSSRYPHEFSGGQKQRIGIARAISLNPKLIVCDEPVSALDVSIQAQILNILKSLQKELDLTYIFIAHGIPAVNHVSNRIVVMYLGKIVEITQKNKIYESPRHPYTEGLINAVPISNPKFRKENNNNILKGENPSPVNLPSGCRFRTRCPYAQDICKEKEPNLQKMEDGTEVACHFPLKINNKIGG